MFKRIPKPLPKTLTTMTKQIHQPIHPSLRPLLDPEYLSFHDKHYAYSPPITLHTPFDPSIRSTPPPWGNTELNPPQKASTRDLDLPHFPIRIFTPPSTPPPETGHRVLLWLHGGGWTLGDLSMNNEICHAISLKASCTVISVGYRLAPEHPYPAAIEDALYALRWVHGDSGARELGKIDRGNVAVAGTSSGGGLAAVLSMKAAEAGLRIPVKFQLLVVPVIDNTATEETAWKSRRFAPWLTPERMKWYRGQYLREPGDAEKWDASPCFAPVGVLAGSPRTWVAVAEQDILFEEGVGYAAALREAWQAKGVREEAVVKVYEKSTHTILSMSGVLSKGRELVKDAAEQAAKWFAC